MDDNEDTTQKPKKRGLEWLYERTEQAKREMAAQLENPKNQPVVPLQSSLPVWPDEVRGVPNAILRGALFGIGQERIVHQKRTLIAAVEGYEIRFKGETFNQTDLDVLEAMLHLAMPHPLGKRVEFTVYSFLKAIGRGTSGKHHEEFKEQVVRLMGGVVEITDTKARKTFMGTLVSEAFREEDTGRYVIVFNNKMLNLYEGGYSHIDWDQRMALGKSALAKWLHGFYATHAKPYPYKVETLRTLCGSQTGELFKFRQQLRKAFNELVSVSAIQSWNIDDDDLVSIQRTPSSTQQKHLNRAAKRP